MQLHDPFRSLPVLAGDAFYEGLTVMQNNARYACIATGLVNQMGEQRSIQRQ